MKNKKEKELETVEETTEKVIEKAKQTNITKVQYMFIDDVVFAENYEKALEIYEKNKRNKKVIDSIEIK